MAVDRQGGEQDAQAAREVDDHRRRRGTVVADLAASMARPGMNQRLWRVRSAHSRMRIGQGVSLAPGSGSADALAVGDGTGVGDGAGSPGRAAIRARLMASSTPMSRKTNSPLAQV